MNYLEIAQAWERRARQGSCPLCEYPARGRDCLAPLRSRDATVEAHLVKGTSYYLLGRGVQNVGAAHFDPEKGLLSVFGLDLPEYKAPKVGQTQRVHVALAREDWADFLDEVGLGLGPEKKVVDVIRATLAARRKRTE